VKESSLKYCCAFIFATDTANLYVISAYITQLTSDYDVLIDSDETSGFSQELSDDKGIASIRNSLVNCGAYLASMNHVTENS
jgi:hypothetical protein